MTDTLEDPFDQYSIKEGWPMIEGTLDPNSPKLSPEQREYYEAKQQREYELNSTIHRCFSSPEGQIVFDYMREIATEGARFDIANETDPALAAAKGFFREGQAAFYFDLKHRMNAALKGPPSVRE